MSRDHGTIATTRRVAAGRDRHGLVTGTGSGAPGRRLAVRGTVWRDVVRDDGSSVQRSGTVSGDVSTRGGERLVAGSSGGPLPREGGTTLIDPGAAIAGPILEDGASSVDRRRPFPAGPSKQSPL